ncbi:MAG: hypothetical protein EOM31_13030 [Bacteroidia bacterium]|nr:hypothetical protein [Bacteroidia bacterium]
MKHLVITETNRIAYGLTRKIAIMPRVFTIDATLERDGHITILFLDNNRGLIHNITLCPPKEYKKAFDGMTYELAMKLGESLTASIAFDISYFIANGKYYSDDEDEYVDYEPGVFDIGVKAEEWYTDVVFELSTYTRRPANKEDAEKKEKSEKK